MRIAEFLSSLEEGAAVEDIAVELPQSLEDAYDRVTGVLYRHKLTQC